MQDILDLVGSERHMFGSSLTHDQTKTLLAKCPEEFHDPHNHWANHITTVMITGTIDDARKKWSWKIPDTYHDASIELISCVLQSHSIGWRQQAAIAGWIFSLMVEWNDHYHLLL